MSGHGAHSVVDPGLLLALPALAALALALGAVAGERRRDRPWPPRRLLLLVAGVLVVVASGVGPFVQWAHVDPRGAVASHLVLGMLAPLLLVLSAPVTLALRALDVVPARRLSRLLRSRPMRAVAHPVPALLLSTGSLWLVHAAGLMEAAHADPLLHALLGLHFLLSGCLLTAALVGVDPSPHRAQFPLRLLVLFASIAAHSLLATVVYAEAVDEAGRQAALLLYYGGDLLEIALATVLCAQQFTRSAPRRLSAPVATPAR